MNRKQFLQKLGIGTASLFIIPAIIKNESIPEPDEPGTGKTLEVTINPEDYERSYIPYEENFNPRVYEIQNNFSDPGPGKEVKVIVKDKSGIKVGDLVLFQNEVIGYIRLISFNELYILPVMSNESIGKKRKGDMFYIFSNVYSNNQP